MGNTVARSHIRDADRGVAKATRINTRRNSAFPPPVTLPSSTPSPSNSSNMLVTPPPALIPSHPYAPTSSPASSQASVCPESRHSYTYGCNNKLALTRPDPPADPPLPPRAVRQRPLDESGERVSQTKRRQRHASADIAFSRSMSAASSLLPDARSSCSNSSSVVPPVSADARFIREQPKSRDREESSTLHGIASHPLPRTPLPSPPNSESASLLDSTSDVIIPAHQPSATRSLSNSPSSVAATPPSSPRGDDHASTTRSSSSIHHAVLRIDPSLPGATVKDCQTARTQTPPRVDKPPRARKVVSFNENVHIVTYPYEGSDTYSSNSDLPSVTRFPEPKLPKRRGRSVFRLLSRSSSTSRQELEDSDQYIPGPLDSQYDPCGFVPLHPQTEVVYDHLAPANSASADSYDSPQQEPPLSAYDSAEDHAVIVSFECSPNLQSAYLKATDSSEGAVLDDYDYTDRRDSENNETLSLSDAHLSCDGIDEPEAIVDQLLPLSREENAAVVRTTSSFDIAPLWQRLKRVDELDAVDIPRHPFLVSDILATGLPNHRSEPGMDRYVGHDAQQKQNEASIPRPFHKTQSKELSRRERLSEGLHSVDESLRTVDDTDYVLRKHVTPNSSSDSDWRAATTEPASMPIPVQTAQSALPSAGTRARCQSLSTSVTVSGSPGQATTPICSSNIFGKGNSQEAVSVWHAGEREVIGDKSRSELRVLVGPPSMGSLGEEAGPITPMLRDVSPLPVLDGNDESMLKTSEMDCSVEHPEVGLANASDDNHAPSTSRAETERPVPEIGDGHPHLSSEDIGTETNPSTVENWEDARGTDANGRGDMPFVGVVEGSPLASSSEEIGTTGNAVPLGAIRGEGIEDAGHDSLDGCSLKTALQTELSSCAMPEADLEEDLLGSRTEKSFDGDGGLPPAHKRGRDRKLPSLGSFANETSVKELSRRLLSVESEGGSTESCVSKLSECNESDKAALSVSAAVKNIERATEAEGSGVARWLDSSEERRSISRKRRQFSRAVSSRQSSGSSAASDVSGKISRRVQSRNAVSRGDAADDTACSLSDVEMAENGLSPHEEYPGTGVPLGNSFAPVAGVYYGTSSPSAEGRFSDDAKNGTDGTRYPEYKVLKEALKNPSAYESEPNTPELVTEGSDWRSETVGDQSGNLNRRLDNGSRKLRRGVDFTRGGRREQSVPEVLLHEWCGSTPVEPCVELEDSAPNSQSSGSEVVMRNSKTKEEGMHVKRTVRLSSKLGMEISRLWNNGSGSVQGSEDAGIASNRQGGGERVGSGVQSVSRSADSRGGSSHLSSIRISTGGRHSGHSEKRRSTTGNEIDEKEKMEAKRLKGDAWVSSEYEAKGRKKSGSGMGKEIDGSAVPLFATLPNGYAVDPKLQDFQMNVERKSFSEIGYRRCGRGGASGRGASFAEQDYQRMAENSDTEVPTDEVRVVPKDVKTDASNKRRTAPQRRRRLSNVEAGGSATGRDDGHALRGVVGRLVSGMHMAKKLVSPN